MAQDPPFDDVLARLRNGDAGAANQVFAQFATRLIGLARLRLDGRLRQKVDAEDVVQSVFKSLFLRLGDGQFELSDWNSLWSLLVVITLRKCGRQVQHFRGQRHDVRKEVGPLAPADDSDGGWEPLAREPTPSEAAVLTETLEKVMGGA